MKLVIGSDHGGFATKEEIRKALLREGYDVTDFGCYSEEAVDYPDIALLVAEAVARRDFDRGILLDGTGGGVSMTANKVPGIRAVLAYSEMTGRYASEHDDANILCLGGRMLGAGVALEIARVWLKTPFGGERHLRRLSKVQMIERKYARA